MEVITVRSNRRNELIDINQQVADIVAKSEIKEACVEIDQCMCCYEKELVY